MTKKQNIEHATNWNAIMVLWGFMLMLFIALSLFVPNVPVPWLHWICGLVPSARYMVSVSLFPNVASTVFSVMWGLTPLLIFFYLQRLHFTPCSIEEFRKNKILNFFLIGILMPAMIISSLFLPDNESVGFTGDINKLISESRLFLGVFGALFTAVLPLFLGNLE